jgi:tetratricopeptide (TPR) repeat protein
MVAHADDYEDANQLFKQGQHSQALDKVNDYLDEKPKDAQARFLKGLILTEQGKKSDAIKIFSALTDDYPDLPEPYNNLAVLYASQGQYDKAQKLLERAISTHPSYATAHENLGDIYAKMASQAYDRALALDHANTATQTKLAMIQNLFAGEPHNNLRNKEVVARNLPPQSSVELPTPIIAGHTSEPAQSPATRPQPPPSFSSQHIDTSKSSKEVTATLMAWAAAWSAKNTNKYLSFYAKDFQAPAGETRASWEAARRERISAPKTIHVDVRIMTIQFPDNTHAVVKFRQSYRATHLKTVSNKTLLMVKFGDKWLIQQDRSK